MRPLAIAFALPAWSDESAVSGQCQRRRLGARMEILADDYIGPRRLTLYCFRVIKPADDNSRFWILGENLLGLFF